jgi:hypothetical protein
MQMNMDSYYYAGFQDDDYPHGVAPASMELPFGFDNAPPLVEPPGSAFPGYEGAAAGPEVIMAGAGQGVDALGVVRADRDQCRTKEEAGSSVESSRGFRHMMRERQRREKLSQSYADLYAMVVARSKVSVLLSGPVTLLPVSSTINSISVSVCADPRIEHYNQQGDKNSIVQSAAIYIHELKGAREQLQRRNEELKARILGHDARHPSVKVDFEVDDPASGIDSMIGALRRLKSMGVKATGIRSNMSGGRLWTEMNIQTTVSNPT